MHFLTPDLLRKLIRLFDYKRLLLPGLDSNLVEGIPAWFLRKIVGDARPEQFTPWLARSGYAGIYALATQGATKLIPVERSHIDGVLRLCDINVTDPFISVDQVAMYRMNYDQFAGDIANQLKLFRTKSIEESIILDDFLWLLGDSIIGQKSRIPVFLVRQLPSVKKKVVRLLEQISASGLVLSTADELDTLLRWPAGIEDQLLWDALCGKGMRVNYAPNLFGPSQTIQVMGNSHMPTISEVKIIYGDDGEILLQYDVREKSLFVPGKPVWYLKGDRGPSVIECLFEQASIGRYMVSNVELMTRTQSYEGGAKHISSVFSGNPRWQDFIGSPMRGQWGFRKLFYKIHEAADA